ncbi:phenol 2-monooxygenase [Gordonia sihwensis]|uniref:phenol 2-monooxygenase n=1 Tax=Gordonia TaxID=2053 RepID=UPI00241698CB|nr:phenol 2-monooxygenase [Gordonia sihwensis]WFN92167.1 phenol 2-monooxygenase [Gordonia sihwensis]
MQFELRYQTIEPKRQTYQNIIERFGDEPATRYQEATLDIEPRENFHYRPTWTPDHELYDAGYSALKLTDPYAFADPRQFYYTPYVTNRAALHDEFGKTLAYLENRGLLAKLPGGWAKVLSEVVVPLRHYEAGAQLVSVAGSRFAYGTSLSQCASFAAFDRIGNAQMLSRAGIAAGGGTAEVLKGAKQTWMTADHLQPLRRLVEEIMVVDDWAEGLLAIDAVDRALYPAVYSGLDDRALLGGAGAYSLFAQYLTTWFADQRKWLDALIKCWRVDPEHGDDNVAVLDRIEERWGARAAEAVGALTEVVDGAVGAEVPE